MADIFLSYAREDRDCAAAIVRALNEVGLSVWFDQHTPAASQWENVLKRELERARCVLMLWSDHAMTSHWVPEEGMAGLERAVLVPVQIRVSDIPEAFGSIQFADLTSWNGDPTTPVFIELLRCIREQMLPHCEIAFDSPLQLSADSLRELYDCYFNVAARLGCVPIPGRFLPPQSPEAQRRLRRAVASLQVSIEWHAVLKLWYANPERQKAFIDRVARIERHIPLIWLRLLTYSGPFFSSVSSTRAHENFLRFASIMFFHEMFAAAKSTGQHVDIRSHLTEAELEFPRWERAISALFEPSDEVVTAYVTHIDDEHLETEEVVYGPRQHSQLAYGRSLKNSPYTDPVWLEQYLIPQRELRLALEGSPEHTEYRGNVRLRKITDLNGHDLDALYG